MCLCIWGERKGKGAEGYECRRVRVERRINDVESIVELGSVGSFVKM